MPAIETEDLSFTYPASKDRALKRLSLKIEQGEFVAVIGANNAGKSSLCYALAGVIPHLYHGQLRGHVRVYGRDNAESSVAEIATTLALVMQMPEKQLSGVRFTVREEVAFNLENRGIDRREIKARVDAVLHLTGMIDVADRSPHHLSGGQLQKIIIAAALAGDAPIIVLDEPTTFLDPLSARQVFDVLQRLHQLGKTVILTEQRLESIARYVPRVIALYKGEKVLDGPSAEILPSPVLKEIGLDWTRFTKIAALARVHGVWREGKTLATTLADTVSGLV